MNIRGGIKAFQCTHCSARFSYDVHLKRHTRAKHKNLSSSSNNGGGGNSTTATMASLSSNSLPSNPVFQPTSLRQASI
ncbi:hypothetical protein ACTXT7_012776 [Hymenolepis weldensis]